MSKASLGNFVIFFIILGLKILRFLRLNIVFEVNINEDKTNKPSLRYKNLTNFPQKVL